MQVAEPGAPRQTHAFLSRTRTLEPILGFGQKTENPSARSQNHPVQPPNTTKQHLYLSKIHLLLFLSFLFSSLSLSPPPSSASVCLSLSHTHLKHMHAQAGRHSAKVAFPVRLRQHDSYFRVVTCSAGRRGRCKADTKRRQKKKRLQTQSEGKERKKQTILLITTKGKIKKRIHLVTRLI